MKFVIRVTLVFLSTKCLKDLLCCYSSPLASSFRIPLPSSLWNRLQKFVLKSWERKWFASLIYLYFLRNFSLTLKIVFVGNFNLFVGRKLHSLGLNCISSFRFPSNGRKLEWDKGFTLKCQTSKLRTKINFERLILKS